VTYGWGGAFLALAIVAFFSCLAAAMFLRYERRFAK
jgi:sugar phosphate permease